MEQIREEETGGRYVASGGRSLRLVEVMEIKKQDESFTCTSYVLTVVF